MILRLEEIGRQIGARTLFESVSLVVHPGDRIGLVGPNGAGKSTLLRIACGEETPDTGRVIRPHGIRVARLRQEIDPTLDRSVREETATVFAALEAQERELADLEARMASLGARGAEVPRALAERYDRTRASYEQRGGFEREARVERSLAGLGFDAEARARPLRSFSGGWLMRVELAKLLLSEPDVMLLDEPTNHLDLPSIQWFEATLGRYRGAALIVSHDRTFLRRHVARVAELDRGRLTVYEGSFDRYIEQREARRRQQEATRRAQDRRRAHTERFIERFRAKASKARQVQSRIKALERIERVEVEPAGHRSIRLRIPEPARAGEVVMKLEGVHKSYGSRRVYAGVDLTVRRGDRVALVGPNGAGKSTLLRIIAGHLPFEGGVRTAGHNVSVAYYAKHQLEALDRDRSVLAELASVARSDETSRLRGHLGAFLFSGSDVEKKVAVLSGGEKARLALAKLLFRPANLLVLDEPTNHLDLDACQVLEEALGQYGGSTVLISHDRSFINALTTRVIEVRAGRLREFPGNYDNYLRSRPEEAGLCGGESTSVEHPAGAAPEAERRRARAARAETRERKKARDRAARRLAAVEAEIAAAEEQLEALQWRLGDPALQRDGEGVRALEAERTGLRERIAELYREWEGLAEEIEASEDSGRDA